MDTLSSETPSIGRLDGAETDLHNSRDKGGFLSEVQEDPGGLESLVRDFEQGTGPFEFFPGFANTDSRRGVFRVLMDESVLEEIYPDRFPVELCDGYSLEAVVPVGEGACLGWLGTFNPTMDRPPESRFAHRAGENLQAIGMAERPPLSSPIAGSNLSPGESTRFPLPEGFTHEFPGPADVDQEDRDVTLDLWQGVYDDCYLVEIDDDLVNSYYGDKVLASVVRNPEGKIVSTAAAEPARIEETPLGDLEIVELSEFATAPEYEGQGLAAHNGQQLLNVVQDYGVDAAYSQNTTAEPGMTGVAANLGGEFGGLLSAHATVGNPFQDLLLTYYSGDNQ